MDDIETAWEAVHAALACLPGWEATRSQWHPEGAAWAATAFHADTCAGSRLGPRSRRAE